MQFGERVSVPVPPWVSEALGKRVPVNLQLSDLGRGRRKTSRHCPVRLTFYGTIIQYNEFYEKANM